MDNKKIVKAFELFDQYNSKDPKQYTWNNEAYPQELFLAQQLHQWVLKLDPAAAEPLLLASRCQHIGRWEVPRDTYPDGKAGYLNWRSNLAKYHAQKAEELLLQAGCDEETISKVKQINLKQQLKTDPEVQTMENALCLVFLQFEFEDFLLKHDEAKIIRILQMTWAKMSDAGREAALVLNFSPKAEKIVKKALS
ncbi:MAG TPA: DUF4202 domain-containing protein [Pedobacter sp.]|jgi:hypothetical protein